MQIVTECEHRTQGEGAGQRDPIESGSVPHRAEDPKDTDGHYAGKRGERPAAPPPRERSHVCHRGHDREWRDRPAKEEHEQAAGEAADRDGVAATADPLTVRTELTADRTGEEEREPPPAAEQPLHDPAEEGQRDEIRHELVPAERLHEERRDQPPELPAAEGVGVTLEQRDHPCDHVLEHPGDRRDAHRHRCDYGVSTGCAVMRFDHDDRGLMTRRTVREVDRPSITIIMTATA